MYGVTYDRVTKTFPEKPWMDAILKHGANPPIHKLGESLISYGLYLWDSKGLDACDEYDRNALAEAFLYIAKILDFYEVMDKSKQGAFKARLEAAFHASNDMRALSFEIFVYYTLINYGWCVVCKDDDESGETYDYLASKSEKQLQLECKSFSYDKGLAISASEAQKLASGLLGAASERYDQASRELCVITVNIIEKLPRNPVEISKICEDIRGHIECCEDFHGERYSIQTTRYSNVQDISSGCASVLPVKSEGVELFCAVPQSSGDESRTCLRITTVGTSAFWREFEKVCKSAAKKQLNKDKASALVVHASNVEIMSAMMSDKRLESKIKNIFNQPHLVEMVFVSNSGVYEQDEYPYVCLNPIIKSYINDRNDFEWSHKVFETQN